MSAANRLAVGLIVLCTAGSTAARAAAVEPPPLQDPAQDAEAAAPTEPKWTLEVYGGVSINPSQGNGSGGVPTTGSLIGGRLSASTLYFGNATQLFNQAVAAVGAQSSQMLASLDSVLVRSTIQRKSRGAAFGVRLGRDLGRRFVIAGAVELAPGDFHFTGAATSGIETVRTSYVPALTRALSSMPAAVTSDSTFTPQNAGQLFASGTVEINLKTTGNAIPYLALGAGLVFNLGDPPEATLAGQYQIGSPAQIFGSDIVRLRYSVEDRQAVWTGGGGVKFFFSPRWGFRADGRVHAYRNKIVTLVDTTPSISLSTTGVPLPLINLGALQLSSTAPMNGVSILGSPTFRGSGLQAHISATAGLFLRF